MSDAAPMPTPEAWKAGNLPYSAGLTLETAKKMLEAAEKEAKKQGLLMTIAVVDSGGNLMALHRMDNVSLFTIQISMDKAYTAVYGKFSTADWETFFKSGELPSLFFHQRWIAFPGGFPLIKDGKIYGGVGVSGATSSDDSAVARAALIAGGFDTAKYLLLFPLGLGPPAHPAFIAAGSAFYVEHYCFLGLAFAADEFITETIGFVLADCFQSILNIVYSLFESVCFL
jgi:uncharacterized protein GlcG (DUF336 family)